METTFIYALKDPNTSEIRYIGKADDPVKRFGQHQKLAISGKKKSHVYNWFRACSGVPVLEVMAEVPKSCWQFFEQATILDAREAGQHLVNISKGGDGGGHPGFKLSPETRVKMSAASAGKPKSDSHRAHISDGQRGRVHPPDIRAKMKANHADFSGEKNPNFGKLLSSDTRAKIRAAKLGKKQSPEACARVSASLLGNTRRRGKKQSPEACAKISAALLGNTRCVGRVPWNKGKRGVK